MSKAFEIAKLHAEKARRLIEEAKRHVGIQCPNCGNYSLKFPLKRLGESEINYWCKDCLDDIILKGAKVDKTLVFIKPPEGFKRCCHCREVKPHEEFNFSSARKDGYYPACKKCTQERYYRKRILSGYKKLGIEIPKKQ